MSTSSNVSVVPDYNTTSQFVSTETFTTVMNDIGSSIAVLNDTLVETSAQSEEALNTANDASKTADGATARANLAISLIPFGVNGDLRSPYTITSTMSTFYSLPFATTLPNSKMRFFINLNVQDLGAGTGSTVNILIKVNTATPQISQTYITDIVKNHNQILSLFFTATSDVTIGTISVDLEIQKTAGSAVVNKAELLGLINV